MAKASSWTLRVGADGLPLYHTQDVIPNMYIRCRIIGMSSNLYQLSLLYKRNLVDFIHSCIAFYLTTSAEHHKMKLGSSTSGLSLNIRVRIRATGVDSNQTVVFRY